MDGSDGFVTYDLSPYIYLGIIAMVVIVIHFLLQ